MRQNIQVETRSEFATYLPIGAAISGLLYPHGEVVLHDLRSDRIVALWNAFSKRKPGDPSLLGDIVDRLAEDEVFGPYDKTDIDGQRLKSVSAVVTNQSGEKIGLFCVNYDTSFIETSIQSLSAFLQTATARPAVLFERDFREEINITVREFLVTRNIAIAALTRNDRVELVEVLAQKGLFKTRKAAAHVSAALGISRASVYSLLSVAKSRKAVP